MNIAQSALENWSSNRNVMLDIESIGTSYGAVVTSVAAVQYCPTSGKTFDKWKANISIQSALNKGLTVSGETLLWWFNQSKEAQVGMLENPITIEDALSQLNKWAVLLTDDNGDKIDQKRLYWWANGANFDFVLMDGCYNACNKSVWRPWHYRNIVDYRTLRTITGYRAPDSYFEGVKHDALFDCYCQIKQVKDVMDLLLGRNNEN